MHIFEHFVCIDWSGAVGERHAGIAVSMCEIGDQAPRLVRPGHRWSRQDVADWLLHKMPANSLAGMDLSSSMAFVDRGAYFPEWSDSPRDAPDLWALVDRICADDPHLSASSFVAHEQAARHFRRQGGLVGDLFEPGRGRLRRCEQLQAKFGLNPYSNFNLVGAAQVGKSSLTGMRVLHRLHRRLPVWPIERDKLSENGSLLVEIYTSLAAVVSGRRPGRSKMRSYSELNAALTSPAIASRPIRREGPISDHQSDAILTAAWMRRAAADPQMWQPEAMGDDIACKEGWTFGLY